MHVLDVKPSASKMMRYYHRAILSLAVLEQIVVSLCASCCDDNSDVVSDAIFLRPVMIEIPNGGGGNSGGGGSSGRVSKDAAGWL